MKKTVTVSSIICICLSVIVIALCISSAINGSIPVNTTSQGSRVNLVIDAGHGGIDAGTIGINGEKEKDVNLSIAKKLYDFASVSGYSCFLVRDGDYLVYKDGDDKKRSDLYNRFDYINSVNNSVLISIHQNHFENEAEWGTQIWYSPNDETSSILADCILKSVKNNIQDQKDNKRENKKSDNSYYLLYKAKVPSVMVECGFMSNIKENNNLQDNNYQNQMAYSIMLGFCGFQAKEQE